MNSSASPVTTSGRRGNSAGTRYALLTTLYVSQLVAFAFFATGLIAILRSEGHPLHQLGIVYAIALIFSVRFLWAPLVDRWGGKRSGGHYRSWLIPLQSCLVVIPIAMIPLDPAAEFGALLIGLTLLAAVAATQDIATDALAVTVLGTDERGTANGIQAAAALAGNIIGSGVLLATYPHIGWTGTMLFLSAMALLSLLQVVAYREPPAGGGRERAGIRSIVRFVRRPSGGRWTALLLLSFGGIGVSTSVVIPLLTDMGWGLGRIGLTVNIMGGVAGMLAALTAGALITRLGRRALWTAALTAQMLATLVLLACTLGTPPTPVVHLAAIGTMASWGMLSAVLYTSIMDRSAVATAGTDFSIQVCLGGISSTVFGGLAISTAGAVGYAAVVIAGLVLLGCAALLVVRGHLPDIDVPEARGEPVGDTSPA